MNKKQKTVLIIATLIFVGMGLFPPWKVVPRIGRVEPKGYSFIATPPQSSSFYKPLEMDDDAAQSTVADKSPVDMDAAYAQYVGKSSAEGKPWEDYADSAPVATKRPTSILKYYVEAGTQIDFSRLGLQWFIVVVSAGVAMAIVKNEKSQM